MNLPSFFGKAKSQSAANKAFLNKLKSKRFRNLDVVFHIAHEEAFEKIDEDEDYVLKQAPCPFLGDDNYCSVYEDRPTACREYPHTDRKNMYQILDLTYKNTLVCPAVLRIVDEVKKKLDQA